MKDFDVSEKHLAHSSPNCEFVWFQKVHRSTESSTYVHVELHVRESSMLRAIESKLFYFSVDRSEPLEGGRTRVTCKPPIRVVFLIARHAADHRYVFRLTCVVLLTWTRSRSIEDSAVRLEFFNFQIDATTSGANKRETRLPFLWILNQGHF